MSFPGPDRLSLRAVLGECGGVSEDLVFDRVTDRHAEVRPGSLFVARDGVRSSGRDFVTAAVERGAVGVVSDRPVMATVPVAVVKDVRGAFGRLAQAVAGDPAKRLTVIGVTGTDGKTTTGWFTRELLRAAGRRVALSGTVEMDDGRTVRPSRLTTPGPVELAEWMRAAVAVGSTHAVMELSSHALDQRRAAAIRLDVAVVTNVRRDHLDYHGTTAAYEAAKARIFVLVRPGGAVVLGEDVGALGDRVPSGLRVLRPRHVAVRSAAIGRHNEENLIAAAAAVAALGEDVASDLARISGPPGRMEQISERPTVFLDYAHTPAAVAAAVDAGRTVCGGRLWVVCGAGGERDVGKRGLIGRALSAADSVILTADNPRSECPREIARQIAGGMTAGADVQTEVDRRAAIATALNRAAHDDVVLVLGKGHETTQEIDGELRPFDDGAVCREILNTMSAR